MTDIRAQLAAQAKSVLGIKLKEEQARQFQRYLELLLERNESLNLTAITDPAEAAEKHFLDSLVPAALCPIKEGAKLLDVGTGAGFPGLPLKILRPDLELSLLDGTGKKLAFLREVCGELGIQAQFLHKRAEEAGRDKVLRESFDVVISRAVAGLPVLAEYCLPLVKMKGYFLAMKGPAAGEELEQARQALDILGGTQHKLLTVSLPTAGERSIVQVRKLAFTPKSYPRHGGTIVKHPLGGTSHEVENP